MLVVERLPTQVVVEQQQLQSTDTSFSARRASIDTTPKKIYTSENIGVYDVLCGRDKAAFNNVGNRRFRVTVSLALNRYVEAPTRKDKSVVIKSIVSMLHADGGKFLQQRSFFNQQSDEPLYVELNEKQAHEKAGHALRDMALLRNKPSSSTSTNVVYKKNKATDQPVLIESVKSINFAEASTDTPAKTVSTVSSSPCKRIKHNGSNEPIRKQCQPQEQKNECLHMQLDSWTELCWDESSELTHDESLFDNLVQSIAANNNAQSNESNPVGLIVEQDSTSPVDVAFDDYTMSIGDIVNRMDDVDEQVSSDPTMSNNNNSPRSSLRLSKRSSTNSFVINDEMVAWLVGESDFVVQV